VPYRREQNSGVLTGLVGQVSPDATAPGPGRGIGSDPRFQLYEASDLAAVDPEVRSTWAGSRLETVATSTPAALPHWSDSPATSLHRLLAAAVHANSRIPLQCLGHAAIRPRLYRPYGIAITDEASPFALRSTRNRLIPYGGLAVKVEAGSA